MRHFTITLLGEQAPTPLALPTEWEEVTLAQYIKLVTEPDTHPLAILTTLSDTQVRKETLGGDLALMIDEIQFLTDVSKLLALQPSDNLPDVGASTYGQLILANQYAQAHAEEPQLVCAPYFYALYCSQQLSGKYEESEVNKLLAITLARPVTEVWADVVFIWAAWQLSTNAMLPMKTTWTTIPTTSGKQEPPK